MLSLVQLVSPVSPWKDQQMLAESTFELGMLHENAKNGSRLTVPETNSQSPWGHPKRIFIFQPLVVRGEPLVLWFHRSMFDLLGWIDIVAAGDATNVY